MPVLRDDALEAQPAGVREDRSAVSVDVLVELNARVGDLPQEVLERAPPFFERVRPEVGAAQLQQVEGVEEYAKARKFDQAQINPMSMNARCLCRASLFLHFNLTAGRTCDNDQARKPSNSRDGADQFHDVAATQATRNGQVVS